MSDFFNPPKLRIASKPHRCDYCGQRIDFAEEYEFQSGRYGGGWFNSKMHIECAEDSQVNGDGEYLRYSNERPIREGANHVADPS